MSEKGRRIFSDAIGCKGCIVIAKFSSYRANGVTELHLNYIVFLLGLRLLVSFHRLS